MPSPREKKLRKLNRPPKRGPVTVAFDGFRYRVGEYSLRAFVNVLPRLPAGMLSGLTAAATGATFGMLWRYRSRMEMNIALAMGSELPSHSERIAVIRRAWRNFAQCILETTRLMHSPKERIVAAVAIDGEEHLKRALAKNKGVIALSAHLGNFTILGPRLAAAGYAFTALIKQPRDRRFADLMDGYRARVGVGTISAKPRREAARGILKALRSNRIVLLISDEFKSGGVPVEFFGVQSLAPRGPATLALRTGAAIVPMYVTRDAVDRLTLHIDPEIALIATGDMEADVAANTLVFTRHLETMIRRYPDQWNWLGFKRADGKIEKRELKTAGLEESRA
ncbi:MAG TPA: lysophospholipid acyltransferase family protein [Candidatus Binatia bacterium]|nr:lysophospholipid acyltransferase family protein [Candidatus Binatia bacterium]